jgi:hypothetical protein
MRVEWDGGMPTYTVVCNEPPEALCRAQFSCDCEVYGKVGLDENGPWHDTYVWEGPQSDADRHRGEHGGDCTYALWLNNGDCPDELGHGVADIPVTFTWDGDGYEWQVQGGPDE